ncbi:hypothetical protein C2G38_2034058 [Gigaspora rosea]|uniref:Uncharacterized protein n=1 Tax=Gigaspora rosea TaxID=44941 RepID=A0A397VJ18_9GLOM|nr:hypothetical protein C2G38_2034058 [Gigaspora rosea]
MSDKIYWVNKKFENWETALDPDDLSLFSILNFRSLKDDFTYDKHLEHFTISKFVSYINRNKIPADEKWKKAFSVLNDETLKASIHLNLILDATDREGANGKDVQTFWERVELGRAEISLKKAEVQFAVNQSFAGNKANEMLNEMKLNFISDQKNKKKNSANSMMNENSIARASSSSHNKKIKTTGGRSVTTSSSTRLEDHDEPGTYAEIDRHSILSPCRFSFFSSSESELDENDKSDEDEEDTFLDVNKVSFDDYLNQSRIKSEWKLKDGRPIADILNTKTADTVKLLLKKDKKEQTQFMKSVIRLGLSSIIDLSSEFENGMFTWFGQEWVDIKRKVYEIVNMEPTIFEGEIKSIIDTIEEEDNNGKWQELNEIEYAITMTAPIMNIMFNDVSNYLKLRWGETLSNVMSDRRRKIDLRIVHRTKGLELSHSECSRAPTPAKVVHDRSKCLRTLKGVLDNFLKEDLTNEDVQDSKILGIQFSGLNGQIIGIDLLEDGLYFGLEGPTFNFPAQLTDIKCLRSALEALYFFKQCIVKKANLIPDLKKMNHPYNKIFHCNSNALTEAKHFKIKFVRKTYFTPKRKRKNLILPTEKLEDEDEDVKTSTC